MTGPTSGLPAGYPQPAQQAPSGLVQPQQAGPYQYGRSLGQNRPDMNPLNSRPAMLVKTSARKRLNEYLRTQGLAPFAEHEEIPALFILIELMHMTQEPLRTDANRAFRDMPVKISTSQTIRTVWRRLPYEAVPYEARTFPLHVARQLLQQIENYTFTIYPELVQQGNMQVWQARPLMQGEAVQIAPVAWRDPNAQELAAMNAMANRLKQSDGIATRRPGGGGGLLVSLNPKQDKRVMDATQVAEAKDNPDVKTFQQPAKPQGAPQPTPEYPQPQSAPPSAPPASSQQYQQTPQGQQMQHPQPPAPAPQMAVTPQAPVQQAGQSTSMKSDLHDPVNAGNEIPETVKRNTAASENPTAEDKQEAIATGHREIPQQDVPPPPQSRASVPPPPTTQAAPPPPAPPPPTR